MVRLPGRRAHVHHAEPGRQVPAGMAGLRRHPGRLGSPRMGCCATSTWSHPPRVSRVGAAPRPPPRARRSLPDLPHPLSRSSGGSPRGRLRGPRGCQPASVMPRMPGTGPGGRPGRCPRAGAGPAGPAVLLPHRPPRPGHPGATPRADPRVCPRRSRPGRSRTPVCRTRGQADQPGHPGRGRPARPRRRTALLRGQELVMPTGGVPERHQRTGLQPRCAGLCVANPVAHDRPAPAPGRQHRLTPPSSARRPRRIPGIGGGPTRPGGASPVRSAVSHPPPGTSSTIGTGLDGDCSCCAAGTRRPQGPAGTRWRSPGRGP